MRAAVVRTFDAPPGYEDFADPVAAEDEVAIHVRAAGIHPLVKVLANGTHYGSGHDLPFIPGVDGVGHLEDGTRVYFGGVRAPFGAMAARAVAPRAMCVPLQEESTPPSRRRRRTPACPPGSP